MAVATAMIEEVAIATAEKPLTPRSILRSERTSRSYSAVGNGRKRVSFEESTFRGVSSSASKCSDKAGRLGITEQSRISGKGRGPRLAWPAPSSAKSSGQSPPSLETSHSHHGTKASARAPRCSLSCPRVRNTSDDLLHGMTGFSKGAHGPPHSLGGASSRGHRMFQLQEAINRAAAESGGGRASGGAAMHPSRQPSAKAQRSPKIILSRREACRASSGALGILKATERCGTGTAGIQTSLGAYYRPRRRSLPEPSPSSGEVCSMTRHGLQSNRTLARSELVEANVPPHKAEKGQGGVGALALARSDARGEQEVASPSSSDEASLPQGCRSRLLYRDYASGNTAPGTASPPCSPESPREGGAPVSNAPPCQQPALGKSKGTDSLPPAASTAPNRSAATIATMPKELASPSAPKPVSTRSCESTSSESQRVPLVEPACVSRTEDSLSDSTPARTTRSKQPVPVVSPDSDMKPAAQQPLPSEYSTCAGVEGPEGIYPPEGIYAREGVHASTEADAKGGVEKRRGGRTGADIELIALALEPTVPPAPHQANAAAATCVSARVASEEMPVADDLGGRSPVPSSAYPEVRDNNDAAPEAACDPLRVATDVIVPRSLARVDDDAPLKDSAEVVDAATGSPSECPPEPSGTPRTEIRDDVHLEQPGKEEIQGVDGGAARDGCGEGISTDMAGPVTGQKVASTAAEPSKRAHAIETSDAVTESIARTPRAAAEAAVDTSFATSDRLPAATTCTAAETEATAMCGSGGSSACRPRRARRPSRKLVDSKPSEATCVRLSEGGHEEEANTLVKRPARGRSDVKSDGKRKRPQDQLVPVTASPNASGAADSRPSNTPYKKARGRPRKGGRADQCETSAKPTRSRQSKCPSHSASSTAGQLQMDVRMDRPEDIGRDSVASAGTSPSDSFDVHGWLAPISFTQPRFKDRESGVSLPEAKRTKTAGSLVAKSSARKAPHRKGRATGKKPAQGAVTDTVIGAGNGGSAMNEVGNGSMTAWIGWLAPLFYRVTGRKRKSR